MTYRIEESYNHVSTVQIVETSISIFYDSNEFIATDVLWFSYFYNRIKSVFIWPKRAVFVAKNNTNSITIKSIYNLRFEVIYEAND